MIHNPTRVAHKIVGNRYVYLKEADGEYELAVFKCRIVDGRPKLGAPTSTATFTDGEDAMAAYKAKVNDLKYAYDF